MSVDAERLNELMIYINLLWSAPLQIGLAIFFLWQVLGAAVFAGVGVLLLTLPLSAWLAKRNEKIQVCFCS